MRHQGTGGGYLRISVPSARRDLGPEFDSFGGDGISKMAAAASSAQYHAAKGEQRKVIAPATLTYSQATQGSHHIPHAPSPASTESLLGTIEGYALSPAGPALSSMPVTPAISCHEQDNVSLQEDLFLKLSALLKKRPS